MTQLKDKIGRSSKDPNRFVYKMIDPITGKPKQVSELSKTFEFPPESGKYVNVPSIHNGKVYDDRSLEDMLANGTIKPTSVHNSPDEANAAAEKRSNSIKTIPLENTDVSDGLVKASKALEEFQDNPFSLRGGLLDKISPELVDFLADDLGLSGLDFIGPQGLAMATTKITAAKGAAKFASTDALKFMDKLMKSWLSIANQKKRLEEIFGASKALDDMVKAGSDIFIHENPQEYLSSIDAEIMAATGDKIMSTPVRTFVFRALNLGEEAGEDLIADYMVHTNKTIINEVIQPMINKYDTVLKNKATRNVFTQKLDRMVDEDVFFYANKGQKNSIYLDTKDAFDLPFSKLQGGTDIYGISPLFLNPLGINNREETSDPYYGATDDGSFVDIMTGLRASTKDLINKAKDKDNITVGQLLSNYVPKDQVPKVAKNLARFTGIPEIGRTKSLADNLPTGDPIKMTTILSGLVRQITGSNTFSKFYQPVFHSPKLFNQIAHYSTEYLPHNSDITELPEIPLHELITPDEAKALEAFQSPKPAVDRIINNTVFQTGDKQPREPVPQHKVDAVAEFVKQMGGKKK